MYRLYKLCINYNQWIEKYVNIVPYYMNLSHKDWERPNSLIWLAEMDTDRGLDFPIYTGT